MTKCFCGVKTTNEGENHKHSIVMISYLRGPIRLKTSIIDSEKDTFENMACDYFVSVLEEVLALEALAVLTDFSTTATTMYTNL